MQLYNRIDKKVLEQMLADSTVERITLSFYQYAHIDDPQAFRDEFYLNLEQHGVFGRIYVAHEGVNGQISLPKENMQAFREYLDTILFLRGIRLNIAIEDDGQSFIKLKIKVKEKIVADGLEDGSFDVTDKGVHVDAKTFNDLANDPNTVIVDMRNHYESEIGHFDGAYCPDVDTFREELPVVEDYMKGQEDKNLLMYCTGGIRCEKASAWFKHRGLKNVYQLEGGIIEYARQVKESGLENKFIGKNFVFDKRLAERISDDVIAKCHLCGEPADTHTNCLNEACHLLFIRCEACATKYKGCCSTECEEFNEIPLEVQRELRKGMEIPVNIFRKGREKPEFKAALRERTERYKAGDYKAADK